MPTPDAPTNLAVSYAFDGEGNPYVFLTWDFNGDYSSPYKVYRAGTAIASDVEPAEGTDVLITRVGYADLTVVGGQTYTYYVTQVVSGVESLASNQVEIQVPYNEVTTTLTPIDVPPTAAPSPTSGVVKWTFTDVFQRGIAPFTYVFAINPNDGGSPTMQKNFNFTHSVGPRRGSIIQEGGSEAPKMDFSGIILSKTQYYALETWYQKRLMLDLTDDLGRTFRGTLSTWTPKRTRRASNPWYHEWDAEFTIYAWADDQGNPIYGRFV